MTDELPLQKVAEALAASPDFAKALAEGKIRLDAGYEVLDSSFADEENTRPYLRVTPVSPAPEQVVVHRGVSWGGAFVLLLIGVFAGGAMVASHHLPT